LDASAGRFHLSIIRHTLSSLYVSALAHAQVASCSYDAASPFWYQCILLVMGFFVGLIGGAVYVNGFMRINADLKKSIREFALCTACGADTFGKICPDVLGLFIRSCLYQTKGIKGSVVGCPVN
jgi:hypothetical protein